MTISVSQHQVTISSLHTARSVNKQLTFSWYMQMRRRKCTNTVLPCLFGERLLVSLLRPEHQLSTAHWITAPCPPCHAPQEPLALAGLEGREQSEKLLEGAVG